MHFDGRASRGLGECISVARSNLNLADNLVICIQNVKNGRIGAGRACIRRDVGQSGFEQVGGQAFAHMESDRPHDRYDAQHEKCQHTHFAYDGILHAFPLHKYHPSDRSTHWLRVSSKLSLPVFSDAGVDFISVFDSIGFPDGNLLSDLIYLG